MSIPTRLPRLKPAPATRFGCVYVVQREQYYKVGFSRNAIQRRARDAEGKLLFVVPAGQSPSVLERLIHQRFADKRVEDVELWGREWFALDAGDLDWLRGLSQFISTA